jgi:hypothetical protein
VGALASDNAARSSQSFELPKPIIENMSTTTWQENESCDPASVEVAWFCSGEATALRGAEGNFELSECCDCPCAECLDPLEEAQAAAREISRAGDRLKQGVISRDELLEKVNGASWSAARTVEVTWDTGEPKWPADHKPSVPSNKFVDLVKRGQAMEANSLLGQRIKSNRDILCVVSIERAPGSPTRMTLEQVSNCTCAFCVRLHRPTACTLEQLLTTGWRIK